MVGLFNYVWYLWFLICDIINKIMHMGANCLVNDWFKRKEGSLPTFITLVTYETGRSRFKEISIWCHCWNQQEREENKEEAVTSINLHSFLKRIFISLFYFISGVDIPNLSIDWWLCIPPPLSGNEKSSKDNF